MRRYKKAGILLLVWMCLMMTGCGKEETKPVTISIIHAWGGTEEDHEAMRSIYEDFEKENPDIILQMISMPTGEDLKRKVEDMIMVGDVPDIVNFSGMGQNQTYEFMVENDLALNLMPYLKRDSELRERVPEANLNYWKTKDHKLYSIADVLSLSGGYWYNENILADAGGGLAVAEGMSEEKTELALEFIKYMTSAEVQEKIFTEVQAHPCNTTLDLNALAEESGNPATIKLATACSQVNDADIVVIDKNYIWGADVNGSIINALMECAVSGTDIDARFEQLQKELLAIIG